MLPPIITCVPQKIHSISQFLWYDSLQNIKRSIAIKIRTLIENTACRQELACEHGLSLFIEACGKRILFDAGQTSAFADNARRMNVDLGQVDFAVLSHGHYDHGGGLSRFLELNPSAPVYLNQHAFEPHYNGTETYIGLDPRLAECGRMATVGDRLELTEAISLHSCNGLPRPFGTDHAGLTVMEDGLPAPDDFRHEQYLLIRENGKRFLFSGCSHKGILNIVHWFRPDVLIGGFHFSKIAPDSPVLVRAAETLMEHDTVYYTGHCTGSAQYRRMKDIMGNRLSGLSTGSILDL